MTQTPINKIDTSLINRRMKKEFIKCGGKPPNTTIKLNHCSPKLLHLMTNHHDRVMDRTPLGTLRALQSTQPNNNQMNPANILHAITQEIRTTQHPGRHIGTRTIQPGTIKACTQNRTGIHWTIKHNQTTTHTIHVYLKETTLTLHWQNQQNTTKAFDIANPAFPQNLHHYLNKALYHGPHYYQLQDQKP